MLLKTVYLKGFRAHLDTKLSCSRGVNIISGPNGAGKTNVLEAIHYICLTKSFLVSQDNYALQRNAPFFELRGEFQGEHRPQLEVRVVYLPEEGKRVFINRNPVERLAKVVGQFPVVVFSPEDYELTAGGPEERRRFINNTLSQAHPLYLDDLMKYRRVLKQRNVLLMALRRGEPVHPEHLRSWNEELILLGSRIILARQQFIQEFSQYLARAYRLMEAVGECPGITYQGVVTAEGPLEHIVEQYRERLGAVYQKEREQGRTLVGPHRDEMRFTINGFELRRYASQGQHRTFGMALKLAKYFYLQDHLNEAPILLLDDVFGTLDTQRVAVLLELLQSGEVGQSFITTAEPDPLLRYLKPSGDHQQIIIEAGQVMDIRSCAEIV